MKDITVMEHHMLMKRTNLISQLSPLTRKGMSAKKCAQCKVFLTWLMSAFAREVLLSDGLPVGVKTFN